MEAALDLEKTVNQALLDLHGVATKHNDPQVCYAYYFIYTPTYIISVLLCSESQNSLNYIILYIN